MIVVSKPEEWPLEYYPKDVKDEKLVLSHYAIVVEYEGGYILHHTITWSMFYLSKEEFDNILNNGEMRRIKVVLDESIDEVDIAERVYIRRSERKGPFTYRGFSSVVIMTTTACNARCSYCYEKGIHRSSMSLETAADVVKYIDHNMAIRNKAKNLSIQWFGGEPLMNTEVMDYITAELEGKGINVTSSMISNGYLFNEENIAKINDWHMRQVQITLDGPRETYNKVKAYVVNDESPFDTVINNIQNLMEKSNITVTLRVNACEENIDSIDDLLFFIKGKFGNYFQNGRMNLDVTQIYQIACEINGDTPDGFMDKLKYVREKHKDIIMPRGGFKGALIKKKNLSFCGADSGTMNVISPDGEIGPCEHWTTDNIIGDVKTGPIKKDIMEKWRRKDGDNTKYCKEFRCPMLPTCRHFVMCQSSPICRTEERFRKAYEWEKECIVNTFEYYLEKKAESQEITLEKTEEEK